MTTLEVSTSCSSGFPGGITLLMSVCAKDNPKFFQLALNSIFDRQIRPEASVIVVDGPVNTHLEAVLIQFEKHPDITVLRLPHNLGLACALNAGLEKVATTWVLRADADDINTAERLVIQAHFARTHPDVTFFGGVIDEVDPTDGVVIARRTVPLSHEEIMRFIPFRNPFNHMTVVFKIEPVRAVGGYPRLHLREDYGLWALLLDYGVKSANLPDVLVMATTGRDMYRRRGGWRYAVGELGLQSHLVRCGLKSYFMGFMHGSLRALVFLLPATIRGSIYEIALRRRAD